MSSLAKRYEQIAGSALRLIGGFAVLVLMLHTVLNAASRQLRNAPIEGTLEWVGNWYLPLIILAGLIVAQQAKQHVQAELIFDKAPRQIQFEFQMIAYVLCLAVAVGMTVYGWRQAVDNQLLGLTAGVTGVVVWPVTFMVPIGFALYGIQIVIDAARFIVTGRDEAVRPSEDPLIAVSPKTLQQGEVV